jgi:intein/homing endonuclease
MKEWSNLARVVYRRTYSRKDTGYLENWDQTVERTIAGNVKGKNVPEEEIKELIRLAKERKSGPAGRGYWFSGAPSHAKIGGAALNNCFSGDEKFITKAGPVSFREAVGLEVTVKTKYGWKKGVVNSFGNQIVQDVVFAPADSTGKRYRSNLRRRVRVTPDHGWFLLNGEKTTSLEVGDIVQSGRGHQYPLDKGTAYYAGFQHGLIFGDGTEANHKKDGSYRFMIRLCDDRTKKYADMFEDVTYPETYGGDPVGRLDSYENLKEFPVAKSVEYLAGFLHGWLEADGNYSKNTARLSSQNPETKQWLLDNAASAGYILTGFSYNNETTNYGKRHNPLITYTLSQEEITWKVQSIEILPDVEEVFCVTVPETGAFTLASGIYTSNCWFLTADDWYSFVIAQDLLMLGGGVGLSVEHRFTSKLPKVRRDVFIQHRNTRDADYIVPDSREGWNELLHRVLESYFVSGKSFTFSTVCLRGSGEIIKGFGGISSGPLPLVDFIRTLSGVFKAREGKFLRPIDAADIITATGQMVVSGNVRRSAIIILGDCWDKEYLKAKRWDLGQIPSHRSRANYSVVCDDVEDLHPSFWKTYEQGEPFGIVNRTNIQRYGRMGELRPDTAIGVNPCVPGHTEILTKNGYQRIDSLIDQEVEVWNGFEFSKVRPRKTGINQPLVKVKLSSGQELDCTPYHQFVLALDYKGNTIRVEAKDLKKGDKLIKSSYPLLEGFMPLGTAYTQGFVSAEGMDGYKHFNLYEPKLPCLENLSVTHGEYDSKQSRLHCTLTFEPKEKTFVPFEMYTISVRLAWLSGLLDGDGTCLKEGGSQIASVNKEFLLRVQKMLTTLGIASKVTLARQECFRFLPDGKGGKKQYLCQTLWRLLLGAVEMGQLLELGLKTYRLDFNGFYPNRNASQFVKVVEVVDEGFSSDVFCFTEPKRNLGCFEGIVTGQCAEATLENGEPCNLTETALCNLDGSDEFIKAVRLMQRYAKRVTLERYHHKISDEVIKRNRRTGNGITGCLASPLFTPETLDRAYAAIQDEDEKYSKELGVPRSKRTTVVKPSGTMSKVLDCMGYEGIHAAYSRYMIQRVRFASNDPLIPKLRAAGHYMELLNDFGTIDRGTMVVDFYVSAPEGYPVADEDWDVWKQLDILKMAQKHWADQSVSVTVYYKREDIPKLKVWLAENLQYLKTISFLCHSDHGFPQAPKEAITQERFEKLSNKIKPIDFEDIEEGDMIDGMECQGGSCPIK